MKEREIATSIFESMEMGESSDAVNDLKRYANQRVKETLEEITNKGGGFLVINAAHFNEVVCNRVFEKLDELKQ